MSKAKHLEWKETARTTLREAEREFGRFRHHYTRYPVEIQTHKAINHAVIQCLLSLGHQQQWKKGTIKNLNDLFQQVSYKSKKPYKPRTEKYKYFFDWISELRLVPELELNEKIAKILQDKPKGFGRGKAPIEAEDVVKCCMNHLTAGQIADKIFHEHKGFDYWSEKPPTSWVKRIIKKHPEWRALSVLYKKGMSKHRTEILTPQYRLKPEYPMSLAQIDGTPISFFVNEIDETGKDWANYDDGCLVIDAMSSMIIGISIDTSENSQMILKALKDATKNTGYFPAEIFSDNASSFRKDEIKNFLARIERFRGIGFNVDKTHAILKKDRTRNPQFKSHVESAHNRLQKIMQQDVFFIGQGIRTDNRKPDEAIKILRQSEHRFTKQELAERFRYWVDRYNNTPMQDGLTPKQKFESKEARYGIRVEDYEIPMLFWNQTAVIIKQGLVRIYVNKKFLPFELNTPEEKLRYQGVKVNVYYDEDDLSEVVITDFDTDLNPIKCKKQPMPQIASVEQNSVDKEIFLERIKRNKMERTHRISTFSKMVNQPNIDDSKSEQKAAMKFFLNRIDEDPLRAQRVIKVSDEEMIEKLEKNDDEDEKVISMPIERVKVGTTMYRWADNDENESDNKMDRFGE